MADSETSHDFSSINLKPIGFASTWFKVKNATPRQPSVSSVTRGSVKILRTVFSNPDHSLVNLEKFSHVWILFLFHKNSSSCTKAKVAPPRLNGERVGVFSTRSPHRPNPVGLTLAKIESIEGDTLHLSGLDLLDGTPILDIKPYVPAYDSPAVASESSAETCSETSEISVSHGETAKSSEPLHPDWTSLGSASTLRVTFTESSKSQILQFSPTSEDPDYRLNYLKSSEEAVKAITDILHEDPRSVYRKSKCQDKLYFCIVDSMHVTTWFDEVNGKCEVLRVMPFSQRKASIEENKLSQ